MNSIIVKLLYNYLNIKQLSTLRPLCKHVCILIDRDFEMLFQRELDKLGPHNDINSLLDLVFHKRDLLIRVLQRVKNATGFVLENSGAFLYTRICIYYPGDEELVSYLKQKSVPKMDNKLSSAYHMDLPAFKKSYIGSIYLGSWSLMFSEYIHGLFHRATKDFQIDWNLVRMWNQTPFFKFIKGALKKSDYAFILGGIGKLSNETLNRNSAQIYEFAKEVFDPMIEEEIQLISDIREGNEVSFAGYTMELNRRMPEIPNVHSVSTFHKLQIVVSESLLRALVSSAALISYDLFMYFWKAANTIYDFSDDEYVIIMRLNAIARNEGRILEIINPIQKVPVNMIGLLAFYKKLIPLEYFEADESQKIKMQLIRGDDCEVNLGEPITPLIQDNSSQIPVCNIPWMSKKHCKRLLKKLEWEQIPYFYDILLTRDLEFWIKFYTSHLETFERDAELKDEFMMYQITLNNVDFIKYALESGYFNHGLRHNITPYDWLNDLIDEYNEKNPNELEEELVEDPIYAYEYGGRMF